MKAKFPRLPHIGSRTSKANAPEAVNANNKDVPQPNQQATSGTNSQYQVENTLETLALKKLSTPLAKEIILGVLAGWWVALASIFAISIAGGVPLQTRIDYPFIPRLLMGIFFPVSLCLIVLFGGELFTGNAMYMLVAFYAKKVTIIEMIVNWIVVLLSNAAGCLLTVYLFAYCTDLFRQEPWLSYVRGIAEFKCTGMTPAVVFARAIPANALVCTSIIVGLQSKDLIGKIVGMWFPVMMFATSAFEHSIANLSMVPIGILYGGRATVSEFITNNLLACVAGNIVGGGLIIGGAEYYIFHLAKKAVTENPEGAATAPPEANVVSSTAAVLSPSDYAVTIPPFPVQSAASGVPFMSISPEKMHTEFGGLFPVTSVNVAPVRDVHVPQYAPYAIPVDSIHGSSSSSRNTQRDSYGLMMHIQNHIHSQGVYSMQLPHGVSYSASNNGYAASSKGYAQPVSNGLSASMAYNIPNGNTKFETAYSKV